MNFATLARPRVIVLLCLWCLPVLLYVGIGLIAIYQTGWLPVIAWSLPLMWLAAWITGYAWRPPKLPTVALRTPLRAPEYWTPRDTAAIATVDAFRGQIAAMDRTAITDPYRYLHDAQDLAIQLAKHYHTDATENPLHPLTAIEVLAVIHLASEDLERWLLEKVPGSNMATLGQIEWLPTVARVWDFGQTLAFLATTIANPAKLLAYPLWRKSGRVTVELQNELFREFYQRYLRQVGYYLIEMYSGRLRGGSVRYREQFGPLGAALHASRGNMSLLESLDDVSTSIAVIGQVKAGKSSLINALMKERVAATSILPETRTVQRFQYPLPGSDNVLYLLDTPGYSEANVTERQRKEIATAAEAADVILLVMAADVSARDSDLQVIRDLSQHYREQSHLKPPAMIAILTHIDRLRPVREWSPPYHWRTPTSQKEQSIAKAVEYTQQLFGNAIAGIACVYTGDDHPSDSSVADEVVPLLMAHLSHAHSAAILKAFYQQLSQERFQQLTRQLVELVKLLGRQAFQ